MDTRPQQGQYGPILDMRQHQWSVETREHARPGESSFNNYQPPTWKPYPGNTDVVVQGQHEPAPIGTIPTASYDALSQGQRIESQMSFEPRPDTAQYDFGNVQSCHDNSAVTSGLSDMPTGFSPSLFAIDVQASSADGSTYPAAREAPYYDASFDNSWDSSRMAEAGDISLELPTPFIDNSQKQPFYQVGAASTVHHPGLWPRVSSVGSDRGTANHDYLGGPYLGPSSSQALSPIGRGTVPYQEQAVFRTCQPQPAYSLQQSQPNYHGDSGTSENMPNAGMYGAGAATQGDVIPRTPMPQYTHTSHQQDPRPGPALALPLIESSLQRILPEQQSIRQSHGHINIAMQIQVPQLVSSHMTRQSTEVNPDQRQPLVLRQASESMEEHCSTHSGESRTVSQNSSRQTSVEAIGTSSRPRYHTKKNQSAPKRKRKRKTTTANGQSKGRAVFTAESRLETAKTRAMKACSRCRMQKTRCSPDMHKCLTCHKVHMDSKKTIHRIPCLRYKVTDVMLYRSGGLNLTRRWTNMSMMNVGDRINSKDIHTIHITLGICDEPITLRVVRFAPRPGDETARYWTVNTAMGDVKRKKEIAPWCLADIHKTGSEFESYVKRNAIKAFKRHIRIMGEQPQYPEWDMSIIKETYQAALDHWESMEGNARKEKEWTLLGNLFTLWFAIRHTTGSSYICGEDTLGMAPEMDDPTYPLHTKVSIPRMIIAQFDNINYTKLLNKKRRVVLKELEACIMKNVPGPWFTIYCSLFILLREASWLSKDRYRHARANCGSEIKTRYSIPEFVEKLQTGCNNLLTHWHYYNCHELPDPHGPKIHNPKSMLSRLEDKKYKLFMDAFKNPYTIRMLEFWKRHREQNGRPTLTTTEAASYCFYNSHYPNLNTYNIGIEMIQSTYVSDSQFAGAYNHQQQHYHHQHHLQQHLYNQRHYNHHQQQYHYRQHHYNHQQQHYHYHQHHHYSPQHHIQGPTMYGMMPGLDYGYSNYYNLDKFYLAHPDWDHPFYWIAQMFEQPWGPHPTYQREPV